MNNARFSQALPQVLGINDVMSGASTGPAPVPTDIHHESQWNDYPRFRAQHVGLHQVNSLGADAATTTVSKPAIPPWLWGVGAVVGIIGVWAFADLVVAPRAGRYR